MLEKCWSNKYTFNKLLKSIIAFGFFPIIHMCPTYAHHFSYWVTLWHCYLHRILHISYPSVLFATGCIYCIWLHHKINYKDYVALMDSKCKLLISQNLHVSYGQLVIQIWLSTLHIVNKVSSHTYSNELL